MIFNLFVGKAASAANVYSGDVIEQAVMAREAETPEARLDHLTRARAACAKIFTALDRAIAAEKPPEDDASARVSEAIAAGEPLHMADVIELCKPPFNSLP
jgi:hypothetical protein